MSPSQTKRTKFRSLAPPPSTPPQATIYTNDTPHPTTISISAELHHLYHFHQWVYLPHSSSSNLRIPFVPLTPVIPPAHCNYVHTPITPFTPVVPHSHQHNRRITYAFGSFTQFLTGIHLIITSIFLKLIEVNPIFEIFDLSFPL